MDELPTPEFRKPLSFTTVRAVGRIAETTLSEDYRPSSERRQRFTDALAQMDEDLRQALIDSSDIILD